MELNRVFKEHEFELRIVDAKNGFLVSIGTPARFSDNFPRDMYVAHTPRELGQLIEELAERLEREI